MTEPDEKELLKEALKEWMDEQYAKFGKFILTRMLWAGVLAFFIWYLNTHGVKFP